MNSSNSRLGKVAKTIYRKTPKHIKHAVVPSNIIEHISRRNIKKSLKQGIIPEGCDLCVVDTPTYKKNYKLVRKESKNKAIVKMQKDKKWKMEKCRCRFMRKKMLSRLRRHIKRCRKSKKCKNKKFGWASSIIRSKSRCDKATRRCKKNKEAYERLMKETPFGREIRAYYEK